MSETNQTIRWGILGAARINRRFIPALRAAPFAVLGAIASRDAKKGREAASQWDIPVLYDDYDALLGDPQIDAVYVPLPNALHVKWALKAARAKKHVLCEKPIALRPEDIDALKEASEKNDVLIMEGFMYRFHPQQARVRELLAKNAIGAPAVFRGSFAFVLAGDKNIRLDPALGGGATWDVGCYAVNVARWMMGREPEQVYAEATLRGEIDTRVAAVLDFGGEARALLDYGIEYGRRSSYEIIGTKGTLSVENMWQEPNVPAYVYLRDEEGFKTEELPPQNHFQLEIEAFQEAVRRGAPSPYPLEDARHTIRACLAILRSIQEGKRVKV